MKDTTAYDTNEDRTYYNLTTKIGKQIEREQSEGKAMVDVVIHDTISDAVLDRMCRFIKNQGSQYNVIRLPSYPLTVRVTWNR